MLDLPGRGDAIIGDDRSVAKLNPSPRIAGDVGVVGHHDERQPVCAQAT
jgi:hypothetical protein